MMSIVIPTLLKPEARGTLSESLETLPGLSFVSRVTVINNSPERMPEPPRGRTAVFNSPHNLYVNPSWNLGALLAGGDHALMLLNDDVTISPEAAAAANALLESEDCLIGGGGVMPPDRAFSPPRLTLQPGPVPYAFGCCMALRTADWPEIPGSMLVYFGDNWLVHRFRARGRRVYTLDAGSLRGGVETTSIQFSAFYGPDAQGFAEAVRVDKRKGATALPPGAF